MPRAMVPFLGTPTLLQGLFFPLISPLTSGCFRVCLGILSRKIHAKRGDGGVVSANAIRVESRGVQARDSTNRKRLQNKGRRGRLGIKN